MTACDQYTPGVFEDDVLTVLIQWIRSLTGVKTIRAYEQGQRPKAQFITVFVNGESETVEEHRRYCVNDEGELFEQIIFIERLTIDVRVFQDSGTHVNGDQNTINTSPAGSAFDVARKLKRKAMLDGGVKKLTDNCLQIEEFGEVQNVPDKVKEDYECRAFMQIRLLAETNEFGRLDCIDKVEFSTCGDAPVEIDDTQIPTGC